MEMGRSLLLYQTGSTLQVSIRMFVLETKVLLWSYYAALYITVSAAKGEYDKKSIEKVLGLLLGTSRILDPHAK
jgi:hypothetical protein